MDNNVEGTATCQRHAQNSTGTSQCPFIVLLWTYNWPEVSACKEQEVFHASSTSSQYITMYIGVSPIE